MKRPPRPLLILISTLGCSALLLSGCSPGNDPAKQTDASPDAGVEIAAAEPVANVRVWSYRPEPVVAPVLAAFTAATGIPTEHRILGGDEIQRVLPQTAAAERPDLVLTVDSLRFAQLDAAGLLTPIAANALAAVPETMRHSDGHWAGISWRVRGIVQRADEARDLDWTDLPEIAAAGRLCVRPGAHVYNRSLLAWQILRLSEEEALAWAEAIHGAPTLVDGGDRDQIMAVADGRCDVAIVNHYYLARMRVSNDEAMSEAAERVLFGNPDQPLAMQANISGIALVSDSPNPDGALALATWMLDPANQGVYANPVAEFPISWPHMDLDIGAALADFEKVSPEAPWPRELQATRQAATLHALGPGTGRFLRLKLAH